jgi:hypothetical protein
MDVQWLQRVALVRVEEEPKALMSEYDRHTSMVHHNDRHFQAFPPANNDHTVYVSRPTNSFAGLTSGNIYEQAIVKRVPSHGSELVLSLLKGQSRDSFAGRPLIYYDLPASEVEGIAVDLGRRKLGNKECL